MLAGYSLRLGAALLRHRAEVAERASRVEAELASKVKSELIANISHELRTPLNAILGFSRLLRGAEAAPVEAGQVAEYAGFINDSAVRLLNLVNDVITISKIQSGKLEIDLDDVYADELIETVARWARGHMGDKQLHLIEKVEEGFPPVRGGFEELKSVLMRLTSNAIAFTKEGGTVALIAKRAPGGRLLMAVSDTGVGMTPEAIALALKPFGQADTRLDRAHEGAGLGLPIAKALVELQGGTLMLTSRPGVGTDAVVLMPESRAAATPRNTPQPEAAVAAPRRAAGGT